MLFKAIAFSRWVPSDILTVTTITQRHYKRVGITTDLTEFNYLFILFGRLTSTYFQDIYSSEPLAKTSSSTCVVCSSTAPAPLLFTLNTPTSSTRRSAHTTPHVVPVIVPCRHAGRPPRVRLCRWLRPGRRTSLCAARLGQARRAIRGHTHRHVRRTRRANTSMAAQRSCKVPLDPPPPPSRSRRPPHAVLHRQEGLGAARPRLQPISDFSWPQLE